MEHRTNESSELNGVQQHSGTSLPRWLQEQPTQSNGARIKVTLSANLVAAIKANGNCHCSPLLGLDPFWMKAVTKTPKDDHCGCRDAFHTQLFCILGLLCLLGR